MKFDRAAVEKEIHSWEDKCGFVMPDRTRNLFDSLLDDAMQKAGKEASVRDVLMALVVGQQRVLSLWGK